MDMYLLNKDRLLIKRRFTVLFVFFTAILLIYEIRLGGTSAPPPTLPVYACLFTYMLVGMLYEKDEDNSASCLLISATYSRRDIMRSRFLFLVGLSLAFVLYCALIKLALRPSHFHILLADCILGMLTAVCVAGVVIPILSKFRYSKAQSVITAAFFALFIAGMLAAAHCRGLTSKLAGLLEMRMPTVLLIAVICASVLFVSYHISMHMFGAREF